MNDEIEKIAIFGANGSIGSALSAHYQKKSKVYAFTRDDFGINNINLEKILLDDYKEETLLQFASDFENNFFNKIIVCIGILHDKNFMPEKRIGDFSSDQFIETILSLIHISEPTRPY